MACQGATCLDDDSADVATLVPNDTLVQFYDYKLPQGSNSTGFAGIPEVYRVSYTLYSDKVLFIPKYSLHKRLFCFEQ